MGKAEIKPATKKELKSLISQLKNDITESNVVLTSIVGDISTLSVEKKQTLRYISAATKELKSLEKELEGRG
jgi:hypothetical protein